VRWRTVASCHRWGWHTWGIGGGAGGCKVGCLGDVGTPSLL